MRKLNLQNSQELVWPKASWVTLKYNDYKVFLEN